MLRLEKPIESEVDEQRYQQWLAEHPDGVVVSLNRSRQGKLTVHRSTCSTISYNVKAAGQNRRSGRICFSDWRELSCLEPELKLGGLNHCTRCKPSQRLTNRCS